MLAMLAVAAIAATFALWANGNVRNLTFIGYGIGEGNDTHGADMDDAGQLTSTYIWMHYTGQTPDGEGDTMMWVAADQQIDFSKYRTCRVKIDAVDRAGKLQLQYQTAQPEVGQDGQQNTEIGEAALLTGTQTVTFDCSGISATGYPRLWSLVHSSTPGARALDWRVTEWRFIR